MSEQNFCKSIAIGKTQKTGKALDPLTLRRQGLRLLVVHHLQSMFDQTKKTICFLHCISGRLINPFVFTKFIQSRESVPIAQRRIAAAGDQLLSLGEKFDFPDPTTPKLYIVAFDGNLGVSSIGVDLSLHCMDVSNGSEIQILSPNKW